MAERMKPMSWQESTEELSAQYRAERNLRGRQRLQVLWQLQAGTAGRQVATEAGVGERTGTNWLACYCQGRPW
jgi:hypothetical protein